jgi:hypothetical protein
MKWPRPASWSRPSEDKNSSRERSREVGASPSEHQLAEQQPEREADDGGDDAKQDQGAHGHHAHDALADACPWRTACTSMRRPMVMRIVATDGRTAPRCRGNETVRTQERCSEAGSYANSRQPGTELTGAAENRYHPPQVRGPSGKSRLY